MKSTLGDGDSGCATTTSTDCAQRQQVHQDEPDHTSVVISRDLRHAIDLLREVPHADVAVRLRHHDRHGADRLPPRPVNQLSHRLSLPSQLLQHTDVLSDHLAVRQCSSMTDDVVNATGALL